jgi:hypothetical protein
VSILKGADFRGSDARVQAAFPKVLGGVLLPCYRKGMESQAPGPGQQKLVMWVLWAAFLIGGCVQYHFLHSKRPPAPEDSQVWMAALVPVAISVVIRWNLLPRVKLQQQALVLMILGISLAESALFIGVFIFPAHQWVLFLAAVLGIAQHAPVYADRLLFPPDQG